MDWLMVVVAASGAALGVTCPVVLGLEAVIAFGLGVAFFREDLTTPKVLGADPVLIGAFGSHSGEGVNPPPSMRITRPVRRLFRGSPVVLRGPGNDPPPLATRPAWGSSRAARARN